MAGGVGCGDENHTDGFGVRRECRLLSRKGGFYLAADGFHPAGAIIDKKRGVQHIFIYIGHPNGPAGVFRITRTLQTPKLKQLLAENN